MPQGGGNVDSVVHRGQGSACSVACSEIILKNSMSNKGWKDGIAGLLIRCFAIHVHQGVDSACLRGAKLCRSMDASMAEQEMPNLTGAGFAIVDSVSWGWPWEDQERTEYMPLDKARK